MELQGVVLAGAVLISAFYVLPYIYRRRHILAQAPLDDGYSEDLRILKLDDTRTPKGEGYDESHNGVFTSRNEVVMSKVETKETGVDVRSLARERAKRRARVAKREANRTRGIVGVIVFGVLIAALWTVSAIAGMTIVVPIVASVLFAVYACGLVYVLSQMDKANATDLDAISELDAQMKGLRRSASQKAQRRATAKVGSRRQRSADRKQSRIVERAAHPDIAEVMPTTFLSMPSRSEKTSEVSVHGEQSQTVARLRRGESILEPVSYSDAPAVPSYTLKRPELMRRDIAPFEPPAMPEGDVPYRPKMLGERLDVSSVTGEVSGDGDVSLESLGGGALLDDVLARRRA